MERPSCWASKGKKIKSAVSVPDPVEVDGHVSFQSH
jgi:hypothetical protein